MLVCELASSRGEADLRWDDSRLPTLGNVAWTATRALCHRRPGRVELGLNIQIFVDAQLLYTGAGTLHQINVLQRFSVVGADLAVS